MGRRKEVGSERVKYQEEACEWEEAVCSDCGFLFPAQKGFERTCSVCFKLAKGYDLLAGDMACVWFQERLRLSKENEKKAKLKRSSPPVTPEIDLPLTPEEWKKLIFLCHPDKHQGSKVAEEVTMRLLSLRRK